MFLDLVDICDNSSVLKLFRFIGDLSNILFVIVPIGLIVMISLDLLKNVIARNEDDMRKNVSLAFRRLLACVMLFLVPTFVDTVLILVSDASKKTSDTYSTYELCKSNLDHIEEIEQKEKLEKEEREASSANQANNTVPDISRKKSTVTTNSSKADASKWKYYNQGGGWGKNCHTKTMANSGCGLTAYAIIANALGGQKVTPADIRDYVCSHGHGGGALSAKWFRNEAFLNKLNLREERLFGTSNHSKTYKEANGKQIKDVIDSGGGVILLIPGHYVAVGPGKKCTNDQVYLYDVGNKANNGCYTMKKLWDKTWNNKNRCLAGVKLCGWSGGWAFWPKSS